MPHRPATVNLSALQFHQEQLASDLAGILKTTGLDPDILELEITESMVMQEPERAVLLDVLHAEGCDEFQGYLCRPPLPEEELMRFIREDGARLTLT